MLCLECSAYLRTPTKKTRELQRCGKCRGLNCKTARQPRKYENIITDK